MAPIKGKQGNSGGKNPHMTKRGRFNPNCNVPVSHPGCQISARAKLDKAKAFERKGLPIIIRISRAKGIFHVISN